MLRHECLETGDRLGGATTGEVGIDEPLHCDHPEFLEALRFGKHPLLVGEFRIRIASPHIERLAKRHPGERGVAGTELPTPLVQQGLEAVHVDSRSRPHEAVSRCSRDELDVGGTAGDHLADAGDVAAHRGPRGLGRLAVEHRIGQPVDGHDIAVVDEEHCQQPALARPADRCLRPVDNDGERTQCPKLDHGAPRWLQNLLVDRSPRCTWGVAIVWQRRRESCDRSGFERSARDLASVVEGGGGDDPASDQVAHDVVACASVRVLDR